MNVVKFGPALLVLCGLWASTAIAEEETGVPYPSMMQQPAAVAQSVNGSDHYVSFAAQPNDAATSPSPSNAAPATGPKKEEATTAPPEKKEEAKGEEKKDEEKKDEEKPAEEEGPFEVFKTPWLEANRIDIRGWADAGYTYNDNQPVNHLNGPVAYNDRNREVDLNQLYFIAERVTKTDGCGIDIGGRVDFLFGTDHRFPAAYGLDNDWNTSRFYGSALPQIYGDVAINNLIVRMGHFLAPCGYESVMAPENFFYSHSYGFLYGQPTTLTGGQLIYKLNDQWSANAGLDDGWNDFSSHTEKVNYFGGVNWTSTDQKTTLAWESFLGNTQPEDIESTRFHYCLVLTQKIGEKWSYAFENNYGYDSHMVSLNGDHAQWVSFANYMFYQINDCWSWGIRYEYMDDSNAAVVEQVGPPTAGPVDARYNELTTGLNWKPNKNFTWRSELRYDRATPQAAGQCVFDDGRKNDQLLLSTDFIVRF